jgi:hypothetical protein
VARFYANENFPFRVVEELRRLGHDAVTIQEAGKGGQSVPDEKVLEHATADDRSVLTINRSSFACTRSTPPTRASSCAPMIGISRPWRLGSTPPSARRDRFEAG